MDEDDGRLGQLISLDGRAVLRMAAGAAGAVLGVLLIPLVALVLLVAAAGSTGGAGGSGAGPSLPKRFQPFFERHGWTLILGGAAAAGAVALGFWLKYPWEGLWVGLAISVLTGGAAGAVEGLKRQRPRPKRMNPY